LPSQNFRVKNGLEVGTGVTISAGIITATTFNGNVNASVVTATTVNTSSYGNINSTTLNVSGVSTFGSSIYLGDGDVAYFGDGQDLLIFHNSTDSVIRDNGTGDLYIEGGNRIKMTSPTGIETYAVFNQDGAAELWYDNSKKFSTSGIGVTVTGTLVADQINVSGVTTFQNNVYLGDNDFIYFGDSSDLYIGHNGSVSAIADSGTGDLYIAGDNSLIITDLSYAENKAKFNTNGSVELYYDNSKEFETTGYGATVYGILQTQGLNISGVSTASSFVKSGGTSSQFLKADGSVDSNTYLTSYTETDTLNSVTNRGNSTSNGISVGVVTATSVNDSSGNVRAVPQNAQTSAYILAASDVGKHISITTGGVTVNSGIFSVGDTISIYNNSSSNQTITQGTSVTMYLVGTATTGNRTLAQRGVATILCVASNTFVIMGGGLT
jgi:hypothetical protein